ncbi:arginine-glutamic acid dipeptide repeats protein [Fopius arisanus]|uniref:Arginine-glutamic acid dipeptide repeats protein n=1 Tax=Fopius arisanus TaxID=64838 RepID=A0A0C9QI55_9HYME|nr:PREDICTED: arginine-glutamic acid dipeptide repeats protein-like [Fopius arisanus]
MICKILTYASFIVAVNAYLSHQPPGPIPSPYYGHNGLAGHYGYHGGYLGNNYGHVLPHPQPHPQPYPQPHPQPHPAVNPWVVAPGVHGDNVNPHRYLHGGLIRQHAPVQNYPQTTALAPAHQVTNNNHIVPPSIQAVNQPAPVRTINYQHRPVIPPVFSHHTSMFEHNNNAHQNHGNWAW